LPATGVHAAHLQRRWIDVRVTRDVIRAGELLKIQVLDHVILGRPNEVTGKDYISMREMGFFYA